MLEWLDTTSLSIWLKESPSVWSNPTVLTLHTMGLSVLVGACGVLDLRLLGVSPSIPLSAFRWVFRAVAIGLTVNLITGVLLFIKNPITWASSVPFLIKMLLVVASVATVVPIRRYVLSAAGQGDGTGLPAEAQGAKAGHIRLIAVVSIVAWSAAVTAGRLLAYLQTLSLDHLHLLLNHVPTVGAVAALALLLLGFVRRNEHLTHAGLEALYVVALLTLPAYISGAGAYRQLRDAPGVSDIAVRLHQDVALYGFIWIELAGFVAWLALWQTRRYGRAARGIVAASTLLLIVSIVIMGRAGNLGGEIRHPEIRAGAAETYAAAALDSEAAAEQFVAAAISQFVVYSTWAAPAGETVHFLGMSLSIGVLLAVNLRILGLMRQVPFTHVHRLLPWGMLGFGANLITGMMFLIGTPAQYLSNVPFFWKVGFLMVAGANYLYLTVSRSVWTGDERGFVLLDRVQAVGSIVIWLAILYAGRMLPFLGNAF